MIERQTLHVFHDGTRQIFGFTENRAGENLPKDLAPQGWIFHSTINAAPGEGPRAGMIVEDIQSEIRAHGFCVKRDIVTVTRFDSSIR